jgi:hypothetical protein
MLKMIIDEEEPKYGKYSVYMEEFDIKTNEIKSIHVGHYSRDGFIYDGSIIDSEKFDAKLLRKLCPSDNYDKISLLEYMEEIALLKKVETGTHYFFENDEESDYADKYNLTQYEKDYYPKIK